MSQTNICLNCEHPTSGKFCSDCGQKTDTNRITFKHFIFHDILHGVWHFEKGILFTLKEAMIRPGQAALDYIAGKRIRYYNVFYFILLLIGLGIFIEHLYAEAQLQYSSYTEPDTEAPSATIAMDFIENHIKFFMLLAIPVFSLNTYLLFNKRKFNYSEHIIIFGMLFLGIIVIGLIGNIMAFAEFIKPLSFIVDVGFYFVPIATFVYLINGFYGAFGRDYSLKAFSLRVFIFIILIVVYIRLLTMIIRFFLVK